MIAHLRGRLFSKAPNQAIVEAGGVGYDVAISVTTFTALPEPGAEVALHIHTHVREDAFALYGFMDVHEKQIFERLLLVGGIGPRLALTTLSGMTADKLVAAIRSGEVGLLTRIPGIGKKTAERMVLELREKLEGLATATPGLPAATPLEQDVVSALVNLGYPRPAAEKGVSAAVKSLNGQQATFDTLFRNALGTINR